MAAAMVLAHGAHAQTSERAADVVDDIVVAAAKQNRTSSVGTKTDTPLIETPQSISVVTSDQLDTINTTNLSDALNYVPGLLTQPSSNARYADQVTIRGFLADPAYGSFLRDGLKLQSNLYDGGQEPYALERVDVLRGASSVLYGQAAPGGVINTTTKRGPLERIFDANLEVGDNNRRQFSADVGGPLANGLVSLRLTGLVRESDTSIDYINDDKRFIASAVTLRPGDDTEISLLANYQEIDTKFSAPLPLVGTLIAPANGIRIPKDLFTGEPSFDRFESQSFTVGAFLDHSFTENLKIHSGLRYFHGESDMDYMVLGTSVSGDNLSRTPSPRANTSTGVTSDTNLSWKLSGDSYENTLLVGVDYYHREYGYHRFAGSTASWDYVNPIYGLTFAIGSTDIGSAEKGDQTGIYMQDQIKLKGKLVLLGGLRRDWSSNDLLTYRTGVKSHMEDSAWTGRVGAVYLFDNGFAPYASYATSFQPQSGADRFSNPFDPTEGEQYEAGVRYAPAGKPTVLSAAVYQLTQTNVLTPDPENVSYSVQTGEVRSRGIELEAKTVLGEVFNIIASYTYTEALATKTNTATALGEQVAAVPENTASLWADYNFRKVGLDGLRLGGAVRYIGATNLPGLAFDVPDYTMVDLYGSYQFDRYRIALNVKNVGDVTSYYCNTTTTCRYGDPRTVVLTLSYRY